MTVILAKIFGFYFLAVGLAFIINPDRLKRWCQQIKNEDSFLFLGGILALLIGAFVVSVHNEWIMRWPVIITLLGWWGLIKGFGLLIFPDFIKFFSFMFDKSKNFYQMIGIILVIFGLFLSYQGWLMGLL